MGDWLIIAIAVFFVVLSFALWLRLRLFASDLQYVSDRLMGMVRLMDKRATTTPPRLPTPEEEE